MFFSRSLFLTCPSHPLMPSPSNPISASTTARASQHARPAVLFPCTSLSSHTFCLLYRGLSSHCPPGRFLASCFVSISLRARDLIPSAPIHSKNRALTTQERPCTRCIKRNIGHLCHDEPRDSESRKSKSVVGDTSVADDSEDFKSSRTSLRTAGNASARARTSSTVRPPLFDAGKDMAKPAFIATILTDQTESMPFARPGPASGRQPNAMASNDVSQCTFCIHLGLQILYSPAIFSSHLALLSRRPFWLILDK